MQRNEKTAKRTIYICGLLCIISSTNAPFLYKKHFGVPPIKYSL